jgi:streptogramin lyase
MHVREQRSFAKATKLLRGLILLSVTTLASGQMAGVLYAATSTGVALTGQVRSATEGPMEGVVVSAKKDGSTISISVITDNQGRYSFPSNKLDPGHYALHIRAVGYELDGTGAAQIAADRLATADLTLNKVQDVSPQLTNTEWLLSMPGTDEDKFRMGQCGNCHTYQRIVRSHYTAEQFIDILSLMASFSPGSTPAHPQPKGIDGGPGLINGTVSQATAKYLSTVNLSSVDRWTYALRTLPRPTGRSTRAIITEYDLPRPEALPHDVLLDSDGIVWYRDFGSEYLGSLDPKTGQVTDYPFPEIKPGFSKGMIDLEQDKDGNLWVGTRQASVMKFNRKTHEFTVCCANQSAAEKDPNFRTDFGIFAFAYDSNNKMKIWGGGPNMQGIHRLDLSTGKLEAFYTHSTYGINADSKGNGYGLVMADQNIVKVDAVTGETTVYPTPTPNSGPRRGQFDSLDRLWFAEFRGNKIAMFDTRSATFKEWAIPTPWTGPYDVALDKNGEAWTGGMFSDRLVRLNTKTGQFTEYLLPRSTNIRKVFVDNSTNPVTVWFGNNHGDSIIEFQPLD